MKIIACGIVALSLTACGSAPLQFVANHYDRNDICQTREFANDGTRLKPEGYRAPSACGGSTRTVVGVVRDTQGRVQSVITTR